MQYPADMLRYLLKTMPPDLYHRDPGAGPVRIEYFGTAGFVLHSDRRTVVLDPYVSRPGLFTTAFSRLVPDEDKIRRLIPHADDVLIGHSHHDHVLDAPTLCQQTGARFIGSVDACNVARAAGLPEDQLVQTEGRHDIACGQTCVVRGLPAAHGRVYFNRVSLPGTIDKPPSWPPRVFDLRHGLVLNWFVEIAGLRIVHIDSAEFFERELQGVTCDVLCLCAIGRAYRPNYVADAIRLLSPKWVIPCHWDLFTTPIEEEPLLLPTVDIPGLLRDIEEAGAKPILLPMGGSWSAGNPR